MPSSEEIMKHFTIDPNNLSTTSLMSPLVKKAELNYFNSLSNIQLTIIGNERVANAPLPKGTTASAHTKDLYFFAVASQSGYISLFSSKDTQVKGLAFVSSPVVELSFQAGLMIAVKQNGSISVFKSNVRPFDSAYNVLLADYAKKEVDSDLKEIIPLYEFTPSLNGKPINAKI